MNNNIFQGEKIRLRARTFADMERDKIKIEKSDYDNESDRLCDVIHLPYSVESRKDDWENQAKKFNTWENCDLVIETLDNIAVGGICITNADRTNGTFSYGLGISREHWRKGYASEAIKLLMNYYFNELRFHKCNITVYDFNKASIALHKSLGFIEEGRQRESKYTNGKYYDLILYGMTKKEFYDKHKSFNIAL
jgi:RimJ/RimL family protein N-acetyltransferase